MLHVETLIGLDLSLKDDIEYLGGDIVDDLISNNEKKYKSKNIIFTN